MSDKEFRYKIIPAPISHVHGLVLDVRLANQ